MPGECPAPKIAAVEKQPSRLPHKQKIAGASPAPATTLKIAEADAAHLAPKKRGRPATGFDKKAHDRKKAAERRAKLKAGKTSA